jgi:hypothetical protein
MATLEGDNSVLLYYCCASEIWPDKRGRLIIQNYFTLRVHLKSGLIRGVAIGKREGALLEGDYMY